MIRQVICKRRELRCQISKVRQLHPMITYILIAALASVFYHIGENEYSRKGTLLAIASVCLSLFANSTDLWIFGVLVANVGLYLVCFVYNLIANKPPTSGW